SIFPRSSILLTTSSILPHLNEKAQLSLDFFDRLRGAALQCPFLYVCKKKEEEILRKIYLFLSKNLP
uniref:hypothetical protein n=1 Tax=uncultured Flavonifractor sp. TaxID=1193534 RepID=UPI00261D9BF1